MSADLDKILKVLCEKFDAAASRYERRLGLIESIENDQALGHLAQGIAAIETLQDERKARADNAKFKALGGKL